MAYQFHESGALGPLFLISQPLLYLFPPLLLLLPPLFLLLPPLLRLEEEAFIVRRAVVSHWLVGREKQELEITMTRKWSTYANTSLAFDPLCLC